MSNSWGIVHVCPFVHSNSVVGYSYMVAFCVIWDFIDVDDLKINMARPMSELKLDIGKKKLKFNISDSDLKCNGPL